MKELSPEIMSAYLAGIIDGEGCISLVYHKPKKGRINNSIFIKVRVGNTSPDLILRLSEWWPESRVYPHKRKKGHKQSWSWMTSTRSSSIKFLRFILPYLCIKKTQARLVLTYFSSTRRCCGSTVPEEEIDKRHRFVMIMKKLNQRGIPGELKEAQDSLS